MGDSSNAAKNNLPKVDYNVVSALVEKNHIEALESEFQKKLESAEGGRGDSVAHSILKYVVDENYEVALKEIEAYCRSRPEYPMYFERVERLMNHCMDLIRAIQSKRSFQGLQSLSMAKKQEIIEKVLNHFDELKHFLKRIELVEKEVRLEDIRSTVWVVRAISICAFAVLGIFLVREVFNGMAQSIDVVSGDYVDMIVNFVFDKLGL
jgi:hypothetical protein